MDDEQAVEIAEAIMRRQNVDSLEGFGDLTMRRLKAMLMEATKTGFQAGWSEGWREADQSESRMDR